MYSLHLTHPKWTHTRSSGQPCYSTRGAVGGSVPCSRTPQSWYWRRREVIYSPTNNPCRTRDSNPQPLDYESDSLTSRPRLPPKHVNMLTCWESKNLANVRHWWHLQNRWFNSTSLNRLWKKQSEQQDQTLHLAPVEYHIKSTSSGIPGVAGCLEHTGVVTQLLMT